MKNHIPYGQVLRAKRICSKEENLEHAIGNIRQKFIDEQIGKQQLKAETLLSYNSEQCDVYTNYSCVHTWTMLI